MKGNPKYKQGDKVKFKFDGEYIYGDIYIVDAFGTFWDDSDVSYDIMVTDKNTLYKHINEKCVEDVN